MKVRRSLRGALKPELEEQPQCLALRLYANQGPVLEGHSRDWVQSPDGPGTRDGVEFEGLKLVYFDLLLVVDYIKGFWGRALTAKSGLDSASGVYPLAPIWGNKDQETHWITRYHSLTIFEFSRALSPQYIYQNNTRIIAG